MTKVTFYQNSSGILLGFDAEDHSGYAEEGGDIVCAAISVLVTHTVNSIERFTEDEFLEEIDEEQAKVHFMVTGNPTDSAVLLLKAFAQTISDMQEEESYQDFIDVNFVEV